MGGNNIVYIFKEINTQVFMTLGKRGIYPIIIYNLPDEMETNMP